MTLDERQTVKERRAAERDYPGKRRGKRKVFLVYFVEEMNVNRINIGFTSCWPGSRLLELAFEEKCALRVVGLMTGKKRDEKAMHAKFSADHIEREWFRKSASLCEFINAIDYTGEDGRVRKGWLGLRVEGKGPVRQRLEAVKVQCMV